MAERDSRQDVAKRTCATRRSLKCWTRRDAGGSCCARSERREQQNQTQTAVAAVMATSQSFVARLESTAADARGLDSREISWETRVRGAVSPRSFGPERR